MSVQVALGSREEEVCLDAAVDEGGAPEVDVLRGYGHLSAHNLTAVAEASGADGGGGCNRTALRRIGSDLVPEDVEVGAIRVSVTGWEGWVMEGLAVRLQLCSADSFTLGLVCNVGCRVSLAVHWGLCTSLGSSVPSLNEKICWVWATKCLYDRSMDICSTTLCSTVSRKVHAGVDAAPDGARRMAWLSATLSGASEYRGGATACAGVDGAAGGAPGGGAARAAAACDGACRLRGRRAAPAAHHALLGLHRCVPLRVRLLSFWPSTLILQVRAVLVPHRRVPFRAWHRPPFPHHSTEWLCNANIQCKAEQSDLLSYSQV